MNLINYGITPNILVEHTGKTLARVTLVHRERYELVSEYGRIYGRLKSGVYHKNHSELFPTTGDIVEIQYIPTGDSLIIATLPRKTFFTRRNPTPGMPAQAVAANFDYVFLMQACGYDFNLKRLERYLTLAYESEAVPVIILSKADLDDNYKDCLYAVQKAFPGVSAYAISSKTGLGLDLLKSDFMRAGKTIVCLGSSGIGKSSLVNALAGEPLMKTNEMRKGEGKGRHTTVHRQLILLDSGAMLIDTPGMRELGLPEITSGLDDAFADVEQYLSSCKFTDCKHENEPGCAVKEAISNGTLSLEHWESYVNLKAEALYADDKETYLRKKEQKFKSIAKYQKQIKKADYRNVPCQETFTCQVCGAPIAPDGAGSSHRNHCPKCLSSIHVDNKPGDRASLCKGIMDPIGVWVRKNGEWAIIHRCRTCGELHSNRVAADDNPALLLSIAVKPLAAPPFPLGELEHLINQ